MAVLGNLPELAALRLELIFLQQLVSKSQDSFRIVLEAL
jgi:hypothetical protein